VTESTKSEARAERSSARLVPRSYHADRIQANVAQIKPSRLAVSLHRSRSTPSSQFAAGSVVYDTKPRRLRK
jgi:hypothetical protein